MSAFNSTLNAAHKGNLAAKHEADANAKKEARKEAKRQKSKGGGASSSVHPSDASDATPAGVAPPSEDTALQEMTKKLHSARRQFIAVKKAEVGRKPMGAESLPKLARSTTNAGGVPLPPLAARAQRGAHENAGHSLRTPCTPGAVRRASRRV